MAVDVTWKRDPMSRLGLWYGRLGNHPVGQVSKGAKGYSWEAYNAANAGSMLHRDNRGTVATLPEAKRLVRARTHATMDWKGKGGN